MPVIQNETGLTLDRIVVATDFKPASEVAIKYASALAKHFASNLTVAHVVDLSVATRSEVAVVGLLIDTMRHDSAENMERVLTDLANAGVHAQGQTLEAHNAAAAVVGLTEQLKADLLIVGTESRHGFNKMILGSFAEGVIHHAKCPVVTLGPKVKKPISKGLNFDSIVFATDLRHDTAEKAAVALAFARDSLAKIYICHVLEHMGKDFGEMLELQLKSESVLRKLIPNSMYEWCSPECIVEQGSVATHLLDIAKRTDADLIVLGARRDATWFASLKEGVVGQVLAEAACPVMTICTD